MAIKTESNQQKKHGQSATRIRIHIFKIIHNAYMKLRAVAKLHYSDVAMGSDPCKIISFGKSIVRVSKCVRRRMVDWRIFEELCQKQK